MLYAGVVLLIGLVVGYLKREWLQEKFKKKSPIPEQAAAPRKATWLSGLAKFSCRVAALLGNGIPVAIGLLAAVMAGLCFYFFVDKQAILFAAGFAAFGFIAGGGFSWLCRNG